MVIFAKHLGTSQNIAKTLRKKENQKSKKTCRERVPDKRLRYRFCEFTKGIKSRNYVEAVENKRWGEKLTFLIDCGAEITLVDHEAVKYWRTTQLNKGLQATELCQQANEWRRPAARLTNTIKSNTL